MAWNHSVDTKLKGSAPLIALVPATQIWYSDAPPNASVTGKTTLPSVSFWSVGGPGPQYNAPAIAGAQYIDQLQFQVDIYTEDPDLNRQIEAIIDGLLNLKILPLDTGTSMRIMRTSPREVLILEPVSSPADVDVWHTPLLYEYMMQRTL